MSQPTPDQVIFHQLGQEIVKADPRSKAQLEFLQVHEFGDGTGRGLRAVQPVKKGMVLVQVPLKMTLRAETARQQPELSGVFPLDLPEFDVLAVYLMWARCNRDKVPQTVNLHLDLLPKVEEGPSALHQTMFWTEDELEFLAGSSAYNRAIQLKAQVRQDFGEIVSRVFIPNPELFPLDTIEYTYQEYKWALGIIWSRCMDFVGAANNGKDTIHCIVPFADMFNTNRQTRQCHFYSQKTQSVGVIATADANTGDQVFINYGPVSNARMVQVYGFAELNNPDDGVELWAAMDPENENYSKVQPVLASLLGGMDPNKTPFMLTHNDPLPEKLLWTLRVQHDMTPFITDETSMKSVLHREILAKLEGALKAMLNAYPGTHGSDTNALVDEQNERKKLALTVRIGERKIVQQSLEKLKELILKAGGQPIHDNDETAKLEENMEELELLDQMD